MFRKDYDEAVKWYRLAAAQGLCRTPQYNLGVMYANGLGVPKDYVLSYMWLTIAKTDPCGDMIFKPSPLK